MKVSTRPHYVTAARGLAETRTYDNRRRLVETSQAGDAEAVRQDVDQKPADELAWLERHGLVAAGPLDPVVFVAKRNAGRVGGGDGDPVGVARQIGHLSQDQELTNAFYYLGDLRRDIPRHLPVNHVGQRVEKLATFWAWQSRLPGTSPTGFGLLVTYPRRGGTPSAAPSCRGPARHPAPEMAANVILKEAGAVSRIEGTSSNPALTSFSIRSYSMAMWGKADELRLSVVMGLRKGPRGMSRL
jgi:hypothetical protein